MSNLSLFMKQNKKIKENVKFAATTSLLDENGEPLEWEIKPITTKQNLEIKEQCTIEVPIPGKFGVYRPKTDNQKYLSKLIAASVVYPDLHNKELQDSYGVMTPEELVNEMVDSAGEFNNLVEFIQKISGFNISINEKVKNAKN